MILLGWIFGTIALSYALGSIPFGLLLAQAAGLGDVRRIGSGNIGATNVFRAGRKDIGALTLALDAGKGFAAVWLTQYIYSPDLAVLAGLMVVVGHIFPVWLRFHGGKGVATTFGVLFALDWQLGLAVCAMWLVVFLITRTVSLASLLAAGYSSTPAYLLDGDLVAMLALCLATLILFSHRGNIKRLIQGTEGRFRRKPL